MRKGTADMIKAVFFDIDGTLTSFRTHEIPDSAFEALRQLKANGIRVFIATGRAKDGLEVLKGFPFDGYITLNGQYCFTPEKVIYENTIDHDDLVIFKISAQLGSPGHLIEFLVQNALEARQVLETSHDIPLYSNCRIFLLVLQPDSEALL